MLNYLSSSDRVAKVAGGKTFGNNIIEENAT
jgi:hypothetical protein